MRMVPSQISSNRPSATSTSGIGWRAEAVTAAWTRASAGAREAVAERRPGPREQHHPAVEHGVRK